MKRRQAGKRRGIWRELWQGQDGLTLTEYLLLLGMLTGAVIVAVLAIGNSLYRAWDGWATWYDGNIASLSGPGGGEDTAVDTAVSATDRSSDQAVPDPDAGSDAVDPAGAEAPDQDSDTDADSARDAKDSKSKKSKASKTPK